MTEISLYIRYIYSLLKIEKCQIVLEYYLKVWSKIYSYVLKDLSDMAKKGFRILKHLFNVKTWFTNECEKSF